MRQNICESPRVRAGILAGVAAATAVTATAVPAEAAPRSAQSCAFSRTLCLYEGENFTGARFTVSSLVPGGTCVSLVDHGWGGRAHSAVNTHARSAAMFMNDDCVGGPYQVPGNSSLPGFGGFTPASVWVAG